MLNEMVSYGRRIDDQEQKQQVLSRLARILVLRGNKEEAEAMIKEVLAAKHKVGTLTWVILRH